MEYYSAIKNDILPFVTTWTYLEGIRLSKLREKQILHDFTYMWNPKTQNKQTKTGRLNTENKLVVSRGVWLGDG